MSGKDLGTITHGSTAHNNSPGIEHDERPLKRFRAKPDGAKECYEKVFKAAQTVRILERVTDRGAKHVDTAVEILTTAQSTRESRVYQTFLSDILRQLGPGFVVLCAATLGKQRIVQLNELDRAGLVSRVKENNAILYCPALKSLAEDFLVPSHNGLQEMFHSACQS
jgi:hypothetical protein